MAEEVPAPELNGIHTDATCRDVEHDFSGEGLELPRSPVCGPTGRVGEHRRRAEPGARHAVGPGEQHAHRGCGPDRPRCGVRADVLDVVDERGDDATVVVERHARVAVLVARHPRREEVLAAVFDPFDR